MKKNSKLENRRKTISDDIKQSVDFSFAIVDRIERIMNKKNVSQRDLAKRLGKSESEISKWLSGAHNFTMLTLAKIQLALEEPIIKIADQEISCILQVTAGDKLVNFKIKGTRDKVAVSSERSKYIYVQAGEQIDQEELDVCFQNN